MTASGLDSARKDGCWAAELPVTVTASPAQLLIGLSAGLSSSHLRCTRCGAELLKGGPVTAYATQLTGRIQWELQRLFCRECQVRSLRTPTLSATELLVDARLATMHRHHQNSERRCLSEAVVLDYSPPWEGSHDR